MRKRTTPGLPNFVQSARAEPSFRAEQPGGCPFPHSVPFSDVECRSVPFRTIDLLIVGGHGFTTRQRDVADGVDPRIDVGQIPRSTGSTPRSTARTNVAWSASVWSAYSRANRASARSSLSDEPT